MTAINVYLEKGKQKVFASALDWAGWARAGRDESQALEMLLEYGSRYAGVLNNGGIEFLPPTVLSQLVVIERFPGSSTTDFGAPAAIPGADYDPFELENVEGAKQLFESCWLAFDKAVHAAAGRDLRKGPRGGGRDTDGIIHHVLEADRGYLARIAWKHKIKQDGNTPKKLHSIRQAIFNALETAAVEGLPEQGPRGGVIWPARYFIRRSAWHILDHAWEIEDRIP
jgi:hypothetical protein